jgi:alpha-beta hydrolase superfamily lysophospholipase
VSGTRPIGARHFEEVHFRQGVLEFGRRLFFRKLNHRDVELAGHDSGQAEAAGEKVDEHRAHARKLVVTGVEMQSDSGAIRFDWKAPDGVVFPCERWLPPGRARGTLICVHGLSGAASDFLALGDMISKAGLACFALNLRGQGSDPHHPRRGAALNLDDISGDVSAFAQAMHSRSNEMPLWVCGESMGALILAWMLAGGRFGPPVCGAILSVPVVELMKPTPWIVRQAVRGLASLAPNLRFFPSWFVSGKLEPLRVTRDEEHEQRIRNAPHYIEAFTFRFLHQLGTLIESSSFIAAKMETPCLVLAAGQDVFLRPEQIRAWFDRVAASDKSFRLYPNAYHLLWNDWDREVVLADILGWLNEHSAARLNT